MKTNHPIPSTMHAVQLDEPNGSLTLREVPMPRPQAGLETYINHMSAGKVLLVANPQEVTLDG